MRLELFIVSIFLYLLVFVGTFSLIVSVGKKQPSLTDEPIPKEWQLTKNHSYQIPVLN